MSKTVNVGFLGGSTFGLAQALRHVDTSVHMPTANVEDFYHASKLADAELTQEAFTSCITNNDVRDFFNNWRTITGCGPKPKRYMVNLKSQLDNGWFNNAVPNEEDIKRFKKVLPRGKQGRWLLNQYLEHCDNCYNESNYFFEVKYGSYPDLDIASAYQRKG